MGTNHKTQTVCLDDETHAMLRAHCEERGIEMGTYVAALILQELGYLKKGGGACTTRSLT